jgi:hypothetical protein
LSQMINNILHKDKEILELANTKRA